MENLVLLGKEGNMGLQNLCQSVSFNVVAESYLFDNYTIPILNDGSETWGFHKAPNTEKVFTQFLCCKL